jgi:putative DNA primase/helicase
MTVTLDSAIEHGWSIIPCRLDKKPYFDLLPKDSNGKAEWKPYQTRQASAAEIQAWKQASPPPPAFAIVTGTISNRITIDFDGEKGKLLAAKWGIRPHRTTGSGGLHWDVKHPGYYVPTLNGKAQKALGERWPGLDVKGDHGYAIAFGRNENGPYEWLRGAEPDPAELVPADLWDFLRANQEAETEAEIPVNGSGRPKYTPENSRVDSERLIRMALEQVGASGRESSGFWLAQQLRDNGFRITEAEAVMRNYRGYCPGTNTKGQREPYTEKEMLSSLRHAYEQPAREPWGSRSRTTYYEPMADGPAPSEDTPPAPAAPAPKLETNVDQLAREITAQDHFARDPGGRLYVFKAGVYKPTGERFISQSVKELYAAWGLAAKWSIHKSAEVTEYIRVDAPDLLTDPPADTINLLNGLLDVRTRTLRPHTHEFYSTVQLPVHFDPDAKCEAWDKFIAEVFPADSEAIAWEIPAWLMTPRNNIQKAVLLLGEGSNGKSTFLRACVAFIGKSNTAALSLHKLEQDKFAAARLIGKLANVCPDLPTAHLSVTSMFKALTGGDVISAEWKFKDSFEYVPFAKLVFSANEPPHTDDHTHGFFRRWQVVPFNRSFEEGAEGTAKREDLDAQLADPSELSGVLNKALLALEQIQQHGFTQSKSMRDAWAEFRSATDPLNVWLDLNTVALPNVMVPKSDLIAAYNKHLADSGRTPMTNTAFGLAIKRARPNIEEAQRTWQGKEKTWVYNGIGMKTDPPGSKEQSE